MNNIISHEDTLKHIIFAGRPTNPTRILPGRTKTIALPDSKASDLKIEQSDQFISWILQRAGLDPDIYRMEPLQRRFPACLRSLHADNGNHARQILELQPDLLPIALDALLIGATEFFRDSEVFDTLRTDILPQMASHGRPIRVWSAGCSNGVELYSVAILLAQAGLLERSYLLGTDCRFEAINRAQNAFYYINSLRNVGIPDQCTYFNKSGKKCRPIESLHRNIHWKVADLAKGIEVGPWDLILWRNMAIYLRAKAANPIWHCLFSALAPDGALVVGRAEKPPAELPLVNQKRCVYRIRSDLQTVRKVQETLI